MEILHGWFYQIFTRVTFPCFALNSNYVLKVCSLLEFDISSNSLLNVTQKFNLLIILCIFLLRIIPQGHSVRYQTIERVVLLEEKKLSDRQVSSTLTVRHNFHTANHGQGIVHVK